MSITFDRATPNHVVGRIIGDLGEHIAVAVNGNRVLAVHRNGAQYAVWTFSGALAGDGIATYWGRFFDAVQFEGGAFEAFEAALNDFTTLP